MNKQIKVGPVSKPMPQHLAIRALSLDGGSRTGYGTVCYPLLPGTVFAPGTSQADKLRALRALRAGHYRKIQADPWTELRHELDVEATLADAQFTAEGEGEVYHFDPVAGAFERVSA